MQDNNVIDAIETLQDLFPDVLVEHIDCMWGMNDGEVFWNTDNCKEDLENGDGNTYSGEVVKEPMGVNEYHCVANVDISTGQDITMVFDNHRRML